MFGGTPLSPLKSAFLLPISSGSTKSTRVRFCENAATFFVDFTKLWITAPSGSAPFLLIETRSCAVLEPGAAGLTIIWYPPRAPNCVQLPSSAVSPAAADVSSMDLFISAIVFSPVPAVRRVKMAV